MTNSDKKGTDLLGIAPYGEALKVVSEVSIKETAKFLDRICGPAAEEFGLFLRDKVHRWRLNNIVNIASQAEKLISASSEPESRKAHPRLIGEIIEGGSWHDNERVQELWAGLLASSCTPDGRDDSNLMFIDFLRKLTVSQCLILKMLCETAKVTVDQRGLLFAQMPHEIAIDILKQNSGLSDIQRIDRELDHLHFLGLTLGGFEFNGNECRVAPTPLALHMFARCHGHYENPFDYFRGRDTQLSSEQSASDGDSHRR